MTQENICKKCGGTGKEYFAHSAFDNKVTRDCIYCKGTGKVPVGTSIEEVEFENTPPECGGTFKAPEVRQELKLERIIKEKDKILTDRNEYIFQLEIDKVRLVSEIDEKDKEHRLHSQNLLNEITSCLDIIEKKNTEISNLKAQLEENKWVDVPDKRGEWWLSAFIADKNYYINPRIITVIDYQRPDRGLEIQYDRIGETIPVKQFVEEFYPNAKWMFIPEPKVYQIQVRTLMDIKKEVAKIIYLNKYRNQDELTWELEPPFRKETYLVKAKQIDSLYREKIREMINRFESLLNPDNEGISDKTQYSQYLVEKGEWQAFKSKYLNEVKQ